LVEMTFGPSPDGGQKKKKKALATLARTGKEHNALLARGHLPSGGWTTGDVFTNSITNKIAWHE